MRGRVGRSTGLWFGAAAACAAVSVAAGQVQVAKICGSDTVANDEFGCSVSLSGDSALAGAYGASQYRGAAYVFERNLGGPAAWGEAVKLVASDGAAGDYFGFATSIDGDTALVGAFTAAGVAYRAGAAYVFDRDAGGPGAWGQTAKLSAPDGYAYASFGYAVDVSGDAAVVGAYYGYSGWAYVYGRDVGGADNWGQVRKIVPADAAPSDCFGMSVAIEGDVIVIGSPYDDDRGTNSGSAYVFYRDAGGPDNWGQIAKLNGADEGAYDMYGWSVDISGDAIVVGSYWHDQPAYNCGAAYVYERDAGGANAWGQVAKLTPADIANGDEIGTSVSISGSLVLVGEKTSAASGHGAAYVFDRSLGYAEVAKVLPDGLPYGDYFGQRVSVNSGRLLIGAFGDRDAGAMAGAAYVFEMGDDCPPDFNGDGTVNSQDFIAFLNAFSAGDPAADFNGDGRIDSQDFIAFLNAFVAGC